MEKIDFVITWVDGNDPEWREERAKYRPEEATDDAVRFRDWDLMKYWFRGVEKFAPWVNRVYFVTCGHYPHWLNLSHPKLVHVKHSDYIPEEYLPTFNSNVIELNLHRIPELAENFVLFNDDTLLTNHVKPRDFFENCKPRENVCFGQTFATSINDVFAYTMFNNTAIINKYFNKRDVIRKHWYKIFSFRHGLRLIRTLLLTPFAHFSGFLDAHLPASHLKSTFNHVWNAEEDVLQKCSSHRFRHKDDVTHWLIKYWNICAGQFEPRSIKWGKSFAIGHDDEMLKAIKKQKYKAVCVNDCDSDLDFEYWKRVLTEAFELILPEKSSFEL